MAWTDPRTWAAGETVTAALMNVHLRDNLKALGDPWVSYVPTWTAATTNPTIGNGTLEGAYIKVGKLVIFRISVTFGSTTTVGSGSYSWAAPAAATTTALGVGLCHCRDDSVPANRARTVFLPTTTTLAALAEDGTRVSDTVPFTWATGDTIKLTGMYEAA